MNELQELHFSNPARENRALKKELYDVITRVMDSGNYILGDNVEKFQKEFSDYIGVKYCIAVNSGTDALIFALKSLGIKQNDEVLVPSLTATATVSAIVDIGATPVFLEVDISSYTLNIDEIAARITKRTRAIIAVHLYGNAAPIIELRALCDKFGIFLIEDVAQACGGKYGNQRLGSVGHVSCFSFYPTKNLGAIGDGGAVCTDEKNLAESLLAFRQYGWNQLRVAESWGRNSRLDEIQAAILRVKLKHLDELNHQRQENAKQYLKSLDSSQWILPTPNSHHVYHLFVVRHINLEAKKVVKILQKAKIFVGRHYPIPVHSMPYFASFSTEELPITSKCSNEVISLPMYTFMENIEIERVCEALNDI